MPIRKTTPVINLINSSLIDFPTPSNISLFWNFGSLLGLCLLTQIITGLFLSMHYSPNIMSSFNSVCHISRDMNYGWLLRSIHANGASLFFICMYSHIGRGLYFSSFNLKTTWISGILIFLMTMVTAFLGYVLPWGQMSFWGATVITNLLSAIPYLNITLVNWVWGGFSVDNATLTRFYSLHFILPFMIVIIVIFHLIFLHQTGSSNPLGTNSNLDKIPFHPYFSLKDLMGITLTLLILFFVSLFYPNLMSDPENFIPANPMMTPVHIQPEWYFLFAYAILRSIPNKLGGVCALLMSILIIMMIPLFYSPTMKTNSNSINQILFWSFSVNFIMLTWIGSMPVEDPFISLGQILSIMYFSFFLVNPLLAKMSFNML